MISRKFEEVIINDEWEVLSDDGFKPIIQSNKTIEYEVYRLTFDNGYILECADTHIIIDIDNNGVYAKDALGRDIISDSGIIKVISVENLRI